VRSAFAPLKAWKTLRVYHSYNNAYAGCAPLLGRERQQKSCGIMPAQSRRLLDVESVENSTSLPLLQQPLTPASFKQSGKMPILLDRSLRSLRIYFFKRKAKLFKEKAPLRGRHFVARLSEQQRKHLTDHTNAFAID
jgi:hypothetical protein